MTDLASHIRICVVGLGYVGLPLALEFAKHFNTLGFDISESRIEALKQGYDATREVEQQDFLAAKHMHFTDDLQDIKNCNFYIITVPTPVDENNIPDLNIILTASKMIGGCLSEGDTVVYESTVYPGATEELAVPVLEQTSGLVFNRNFYVGYSPERINPGDKLNRLPNIVKIVSGSTPQTTDLIDALYSTIITAGTFRAESIKVAEAAKVIENTQRDVNIALVNELAIIFDRLDIDTKNVLKAAGTKWNFQSYFPGLVGGHCIGVDPYYLAYKAERVGYRPEIILSGRRINDNMSLYAAERLVRLMNGKKIHVVDSNILILGFTFKENCPDVRNTQVIKLYKALKVHNAHVDVYDPIADYDVVMHEYNLELVGDYKCKRYDAVVLAVAHDCFQQLTPDLLTEFMQPQHVLFDLKGVLPKYMVDARL